MQKVGSLSGTTCVRVRRYKLEKVLSLWESTFLSYFRHYLLPSMLIKWRVLLLLGFSSYTQLPRCRPNISYDIRQAIRTFKWILSPLSCIISTLLVLALCSLENTLNSKNSYPHYVIYLLLNQHSHLMKHYE